MEYKAKIYKQFCKPIVVNVVGEDEFYARENLERIYPKYKINDILPIHSTKKFSDDDYKTPLTLISDFIWKIQVFLGLKIEVRDLFYSKDEKILFWVIGYCGSSSKVKDTIKEYKKDYKRFKKLGGGNDVKTIEVLTSRRYKHMRVFYCEGIENPPRNAFEISNNNDWTMWKWLEN